LSLITGTIVEVLVEVGVELLLVEVLVEVFVGVDVVVLVRVVLELVVEVLVDEPHPPRFDDQPSPCGAAGSSPDSCRPLSKYITVHWFDADIVALE
jgi:hypothetical protein